MRAHKRSADDAADALVRPAQQRGQQPGSAQTSSVQQQALGPGRIVALQRQVGNASVAQLLTVQRDLSEVAEQGSEALDPLSGALDAGAQSAQSLNLDSVAQMKGTEAGVASDFMGMGVSGAKVLSGAVGIHRGRKDYSKAKSDNDSGRLHLAERKLKKGAGDVIAEGGKGSGAVIKAGADIASVAGQTSNAASGAGLFVALPFQTYALVRSMRQLVKQGLRFDRLKKMANSNWSDPAEALRQYNAARDAAAQDLATRNTLLQQANSQLRALQRKERGKDGLTPDEQTQKTQLQTEIATLQAERTRAQQAVTEAENDARQHAALRATMEGEFEALKSAPTLQQIHKYALAKQQTGVVKKTIAAFGSALGVGGSIALCVAAGAAIAGGTVLMASPVGWGLAAGAAVVGLAVAGYKAVKRFAKFAEQRKAADAANPGQGPTTKLQKAKRFGLNLRDTLAFWKKPKTERNDYARALLAYFVSGTTTEQAEAQEIIVGLLGIANSKRKDARLAKMKDPAHRDKYIDLLAAKLAS